MEAALLSLTPSQVANLSVRHTGIGAIWRGFKTNIERPIAVILILNTAAHTIGASMAGAQFDDLFGDQWIWLFSLLFTFAMLQYTEILPKTLGVYFNQTIAMWIARPLFLAIRIFTPLIHVLHLLNRPFEGRRTEKRPPATLEEITSLAAMARLSKHIGAHQERIINRAAKLSQTSARQVMIPIEQVSVLSTAQTLAEALVAAHIDAHTRFPVCQDGDRNRVIGYVNFKEMIYFMSTNPREPSLQGIIRPVHFVEPDSSASDLLEDLYRPARTHRHRARWRGSFAGPDHSGRPHRRTGRRAAGRIRPTSSPRSFAQRRHLDVRRRRADERGFCQTRRATIRNRWDSGCLGGKRLGPATQTRPGVAVRRCRVHGSPCTAWTGLRGIRHGKERQITVGMR